MGQIPPILRQRYFVFALFCLISTQRADAVVYSSPTEKPIPLRSASTQFITTLWSESFSAPVSLTSGDPTKTNVQGGRLVSSDDEAVWTSPTINIAGHTDAKIAVDLSSTGTLEDDDYLQVYYTLNGGTDEIPLLNGRWFGGMNSTTAMIGGINGSSIRIIVKFRTDDPAEEYAIDDARVFTEPSERHAIVGGDWNVVGTWSYTAGGTTCSCVPDLLSDTYTNGNTVSINQHGNTRSLTVNGGGAVRWTSPGGKNLRFWGDARLDVELGGEITKGASENAYLSFNQWNYRETHGTDQTPAALGYPGVNAVANLNQPAAFLISELQINAAGDVAIQGVGNFETTLDINVMHQANITNNLSGDLIAGDDLNLRFPGASFTNNQRIIVRHQLKIEQSDITFNNNGNSSVGDDFNLNDSDIQFNNGGSFTVDDSLNLDGSDIFFSNNGDLLVDNTLSFNQSDITFANQGNLEVGFNLIIDATDNLLYNGTTGTIEVKTGTLQLREASDVINEGVLKTSFLATNAPSNGGGEIINHHIFTVDNDIYSYGKPLIFHNHATVDINRDVVLVDDKLELYNYENANWYFGGGVSSVIKLYAGAPNNTIHYDGSGNQTVITPQNAYWHLNLTNAGATASTSVKTPNGNALDVNGDLTIAGTSTNKIIFNTDANDTDINVAGDWKQVEKSNASFAEGNDNETVTFDGAADQTIHIDEEFQNLAVGKSGGGLIATEGVRVKNEARFISGILTTGANRSVRFGNLAQATGASDASHVVGPVTKQGSANFTFPVGDGTHYRPLGLNNLSGASDFTTEYHRANPTTDGYSVTDVSSPLLNVSACEYWEVERTNGMAEAFVTLTWDNTSCPVDINDLTIVRWDGTQWVAVPSTATVTASGGSVTSNARLATFGVFTLTERNDVPVASSDVATTPEGISANINVLQNDTDRNDIDPASVSVVVTPQHGTITTDPATGAVTYTPATDFSGTDSFRYTVQDIKGLASAEAMVTVTVTANEPAPTVAVNTPPVAQPDAFATNEDQTLSGSLASKDTDEEQDALSFSLDLDHQPAHGTATVNPDGTFVYTPDSNFFGGDQFVYTLCDDGEPSRCDTALVTLQVLPINDAPVATDDAFTVVESDTIIGNVAANDTDPEGDQLGGAVLLTAPANGEVTLEPGGRFTYQPDFHYVGSDQFSYRICDNQTPPLCDEAKVTVEVQAGLLNVPKAFSPNQDQINDIWIIPGIRAYPNNTVTVFNRWGNAIYRARGYNNQTTYWQGTASEGIVIGNQPLPEGTYFYVIDLGEGKKPMSGYVLLKR